MEEAHRQQGEPLKANKTIEECEYLFQNRLCEVTRWKNGNPERQKNKKKPGQKKVKGERTLTVRTSQGLAVILGMDSNAHSTSFGNTTNKRGEKLDLFIAHHKLDIENQGLTPTFQARGAQTIIDITLTARLSVSVTDWTVSQE